MTEKLYNTDSYLNRFRCRILSVIRTKAGYDVVTDRTAFFPEAGGQTCDRGTLGGLPVRHVRLDGETVVHEMSEPLTEGQEAEGVVDMEKRFSDMQQHTGEHILSGIAHRLYGCENTGFHLGSEVVTLDFNLKLDAQQVTDLETRANRAVAENRAVMVSFPTDDELAVLEYRSKKELDGAIRIVTIEGVDVCACCAPHVSATGEIGLIRIVGFENYKGGVRLSILCGQRGLADIQTKLEQNRRVGALLSAKEHETALFTQRLIDENDRLKRELHGLETQLLSSKADSVESAERVVLFEDNPDASMIRKLCILLKEKAGLFSAVIGCADGKPERYAVCTNGGDARLIGKAINEAFDARGGGRPDMVQGTLSGERDAIRDFLMNLEM